jgi:hypothetical protein
MWKKPQPLGGTVRCPNQDHCLKHLKKACRHGHNQQCLSDTKCNKESCIYHHTNAKCSDFNNCVDDICLRRHGPHRKIRCPNQDHCPQHLRGECRCKHNKTCLSDTKCNKETCIYHHANARCYNFGGCVDVSCRDTAPTEGSGAPARTTAPNTSEVNAAVNTTKRV